MKASAACLSFLLLGVWAVPMLPGCSSAKNPQEKLVGVWQAKGPAEVHDPRTQKEIEAEGEIELVMDFQKDGGFSIAMFDMTMFKGRWKVVKAEGNLLTVTTTGKGQKHSFKSTVVNGKTVDETEVTEGDEETEEYVVRFESDNKLRMKTGKEPEEIVFERKR